MSRSIGGSPDKSYGLRARAWWVMRERRKFTLDMLLETVASGAEKDARSNLAKYLGHLERAGVLVRSKHRLPGDSLTSPGHVVWILARDVGRHAPVWRSTQKALWNPNAQCVVEPEPVAQPAEPATEPATEEALP